MRRMFTFPLAVVVVATTFAAATLAARAPGSRVSPASPVQRAAWPPLETAATFFLRELQEKTTGDWEAAWRTLYPLHQAIASKVEFVACERMLPFSAPLQKLRVVSVRKSLVRVPGLTRPIPGVAVNVHVELTWYGPRDPIVFLHTFHLVPVRGHWKWLLSPSRYRLYHDRGCIPALAA